MEPFRRIITETCWVSTHVSSGAWASRVATTGPTERLRERDHLAVDDLQILEGVRLDLEVPVLADPAVELLACSRTAASSPRRIARGI
jgi:hypothetical protein